MFVSVVSQHVLPAARSSCCLALWYFSNIHNKSRHSHASANMLVLRYAWSFMGLQKNVNLDLLRVCWTALNSAFFPPSRPVRMLRWTSTRDFLFPLAWSDSEWHPTTLKLRSVMCKSDAVLLNPVWGHNISRCMSRLSVNHQTMWPFLAGLSDRLICFDSNAWQLRYWQNQNHHYFNCCFGKINKKNIEIIIIWVID